MRRLLATWLAGLAWACAPATALAHTTSEAYLTLRTAAGSSVVTGRLDVALRDLDDVVPLDADGNGEITWGELRAQGAAITAYAAARLALRADGQPCAMAAARRASDVDGGAAAPAASPRELQVVDYSSGAYTVLTFAFDCPVAARELALDYRLFADANPMHRGLLKLESGADGATTRSAVLDPGAAQPPRFSLTEAGLWPTLATYVGQGIWHIWIGIDHILFLVALLLPAVLWREGQRWVAAARFGDVFWDVLKVVTGFTVAHSITLTLATLGWLTLPSRPVESVIAASVALAAANNVWPVVGGRRWLVAFVFGLVHGFGFAGALAELGLPQGALALSLFGFNVGVELGQLAVVALFLPVAYALRGTRFYRRVVLIGGSILIAVLALLWFAERAFGLTAPTALFG